MPFPFTKMHGAGNDFILLDNRLLELDDAAASRLAKRLCGRRTGIGADGLVLLDASRTAAFRMRHYNPDGSRASFCGNGARCLARFAYRRGLTGPAMAFEADDGPHEAEIIGDQVRLSMVDPTDIRLNRTVSGFVRSSTVHTLNTGADHAVVCSEDVGLEAVEADGRALRMHPMFHPAGTNVNFLQALDASTIAVRTYERGVEAETLSCGTGAVACAVAFALLQDARPPIQVRTRSGETLTVTFDRRGMTISRVALQGSAHLVFDGEWLEKEV
jgi:diaminopimelate epimerase